MKIDIAATFVGKHFEISAKYCNPHSIGDKIDPIEMKSSGYNRHASLDAVFQKYHARIKQQYLVYTKDLRKDGMITGLPVYFTQFL